MNKAYLLAIPLILVVFVSGCGTAGTQRGVTSTIRPDITTTISFPTQDYGIHTLVIDQGITINGKVIKLIGVDGSNGLVTLGIDGGITEFAVTRIPRIARNMEFQTIRVDYGRTPDEYSATIEVKPFTLGLNEHYIRASEFVSVAGTRVEFRDLTRVNGARLRVSNEDVHLDLGQSINVINLEITHKRAFDDPVKANRYVVLEIREVV